MDIFLRVHNSLLEIVIFAVYVSIIFALFGRTLIVFVL